MAASVRDVLVRKTDGKDRTDWIVETVQRDYDAVLVHGDAELLPFSATFRGAARIADRIFHTGYIAGGGPPVGAPPAHPASANGALPGTGEVIVSIGGGAVGADLLQTAIAARAAGALSDRPWRLLCGRNLPVATFDALATKAPPGVTVEWARPDFRDLLARADLSVSQAGYNTLMDLLITGCPAVVVPFETPSESEQRFRADLFAKRGLVTVLPASALSAAALKSAAERAAAAGRATGRPTPRLDGARETVRIVEALLTTRRNGGWHGQLVRP